MSVISIPKKKLYPSQYNRDLRNKYYYHWLHTLKQAEGHEIRELDIFCTILVSQKFTKPLKYNIRSDFNWFLVYYTEKV